MEADHPHSSQRLAAQIEVTREIIKRTAQVLRDNPKPSTFLGRATQEPCPEREDLAVLIQINRRP